MSQADPDERKKKINNFRIASDKWRDRSRDLSRVHMIFGIAAIVFSVTVASKPPIFGTNTDVFSDLAYLSALATAILTFLSAKDRAARYMAAYRTLQEMIDRYDADTTYTFDDVAKAMRTATSIASEQPIAHLPPQIDSPAQPDPKSANG
jgi:hypothetical protein